MMNHKRYLIKYIFTVAVITFFLVNSPSTQSVYAENLPYYNYNTNSNVDYSGQQVSFYYNNKPLSMTYPGIIMKGTALADYEELFVRELGLKGTLSGDKLLLSNGKTNLQLTMGSTLAIVNGTKKYMSVSPAKLKFSDGTEKVYIPTRFVAEAFGYNYNWNSKTSTVSITTTLYLKLGFRDVAYSGSFYSLYYDRQELPMDAPVFYYQGNVLVPLEGVFKALGCQYEAQGDVFQITNDAISLQMLLDSNNISINGKKYTIEHSPVLVTNKETRESLVYISLEFVAEVLEFDLLYNDELSRYTLEPTKQEFNNDISGEINQNTSFSGTVKLNTLQTSENTYFEWSAPESNTTFRKFGNYISKISAYTIKDAEIVELYGINSSDIDIFYDKGLLIFNLENVSSELNTQSFSDFSNPYLNYILHIRFAASTKLIFMIPENSTWTFIDKEGYVQVYFMDNTLEEDDLFLSSVDSPENNEFSTEHLIIPLPAQGKIARIKDQDNYLDHNFQIMISGNHLDFYEQNDLYNPYTDLIENYTISYDDITNYTIITCYTSQICGYQYVMTPDYLSVLVARPNELYPKIVLLDAGHGGYDPGAVYSEYYEKNINYIILNTYVKDLLEDSDIKVYYTRETDVKINLYTRARLASEIGADLFISLHMNSNISSDLQGTEVFYSEANNKKTTSGLTSYILAKRMADNITTTLGTKKRGATDSNYIVIKHNTVPAVLIELGFMSNDAELKKLINPAYQKRTAQAICLTIEQMFWEYDTGR